MQLLVAYIAIAPFLKVTYNYYKIQLIKRKRAMNMDIGKNIYKLRNFYKLTQEQFAEAIGVSRQAVQKWESGTAVPDIEHILKISESFGISLDALIKSLDKRAIEEMRYDRQIQAEYDHLHEWESYPAQLLVEYQQSVDEGIDVEQYKGLFEEIYKMPKSKEKEKMANILFDFVVRLPQRSNYKYVEPSELDKIKALRETHDNRVYDVPNNYKEKLYGAWVGRICGCLLGKPIEGRSRSDIAALLKSGNNYPMQRYILSTDVTDEMINKLGYSKNSCWADNISCAPVDDDTNYTVLANVLVEKYGRDFTPNDVANAWLNLQSKNAYCTAERVAYRNFINGFLPPNSAFYKNPYREWIGAQIRGDYFGYINPGNSAMAAEMAWRDASISHVKNGIYGEMLIAAMIAHAAVCDDIEQIISAGLAQIPTTSRIYEALQSVILDYKSGESYDEFSKKLHNLYDESKPYYWCHTISNAMIVIAALLHGKGNFGKSICMAVQTGFDTDCNGATVGSIIGMRNGIEAIEEKWISPIKGELDTSIFGIGKVKISDIVEKTLSHI